MNRDHEKGRLVRIAATFLGLVAFTTSAFADEWTVIAVGNPTAQATQAFADAFHAAQALEQIEDAEVYMFRDLNTDETDAVLSVAQGQQNVILYLSGAWSGSPQGPVFGGAGYAAGGIDLVRYLNELQEAGTERVALLMETCAGTRRPTNWSVPAPDGMELWVATSGDCSGPRLTQQLAGEGTTLAARLGDGTVNASFGAIAFAAPAPVAPAPSTPSDPVVQDVIRILPTATTQTQSVSSITPVGFTEVVGGTRPSVDPTTIALPAAVGGGLAALPLADGLPEPSIIVGVVPGDPNFDRVDPDAGDVKGSELAYDNLDARTQMRTTQPELFATLVADGALDPPAGQVEFAIQTELARMNCYRTQIDGIWGRGSRGAVGQYFEEAGVTAPSVEPVAEVFRAIISRDDVACPTPVVIQAAPAPSTTTSTARPAQTSQPRAAVAAPAPTLAAPAPSGGGLNDLTINGAFR